jgi:triosephosphate isomerase
MPRRPMIAGNWKMNANREQAVDLARDVASGSRGVTSVDKVVCPPYLYLFDVRAALEGSDIMVGAQNVFWEEKGAYTGEISVTQIAEVCEYVIIGHSERRQFFGETDETVNQRIRAALDHGLRPIMCVGETLDQRQASETESVLVRQTGGGLAGITVGPEFVIAYEPVWAIGTGLAADGPTAQDAIALIRRTARKLVGPVVDDVRILYGGSVTPDNIAEFMAQPDIDGGLVGGASLKADSFSGIIQNTVAAGPA